jgi:eukaryotic-like serine/threonine-protein kinase
MSDRPADPSAARTGGLAAAGAHDPRAAPSFGRYRALSLLGSGGMANVYRAEDPVLGRVVALKLIRGADPEMARRLLAEARAQARVEHEHVCRIYDAGEEDGRPYIAMQFVEGGTLQELGPRLVLEQKLGIVKEVAEAVHSAHRLGLIHRDIKPSNVMLETAADGSFVPYVMDFGLAREVAAPGLTMTGMVLGTAWYMSPEQARGDSRTLDRRTDVYALGATLYELLAGKPPYEGNSTVDVLVRVLAEDPVPLGSRAPSVPGDVRTIVMKCLERDPARRYDSARALAEDIGRYLEGEPILARPTGMVQRLVRRARKNRTAVAAVAVAAVVVAVSGTLAVKARLSARAQAALAGEFAQGLQDVGWLMRAAHMAPAHDVRRERAVVRSRLQAIERRMRDVGPLAIGPGEYALGRGQLLLGDPAAARVHLERAWAAGFRSPEAACALGQALGALYRRELETADGIGMREAREARRREIQAGYRDPAVSYLRQGAASGLLPSEYVEGLLAFYEKRYPDALDRARASVQRAPWHYEALLLEGDVHAVLARERHETGDAAGSRTALASAESSYRSAAEFARSDPSARAGLCQVSLQRMEWLLYQGGTDLGPLYAEARAACDGALQVDPDLAEVHGKLANIHRYWANHLMMRGSDPLDALALATRSADVAIGLDGRNRRAHGNRGIAFRLRAAWEMNHGLDPKPSLDAALASLGRAAELVPDAGSFNDLGNAFVTRAEAAWARGGDPRPDLQQAYARYDRALQLVPDYGYAHANRGLAFADQARYEMDHGHDAGSSLSEAVRSLQRSVELLPQLEGTHTRLAGALLLSAERAAARGQDPRPLLARARDQLRQAAGINSRPGPDTLVLHGTAALVDAGWLVHSRGSRAEAAAAIASALQAFRGALARDPRMPEALRGLARASLLQARARMAAGEDPAAPFAAAESALRQLGAVRDQDPRSAAALAELHRRRAEWLRARGAEAAADVEAGLAAAGRALAADPTLAQAVEARAALASGAEAPGRR